MNLTPTQFKAVVQHRLALFKEIKADYPALRLYPLFTRFGSGLGMCPLTDNLREIIKHFPVMLVPTAEVEQFIELLKRYEYLHTEGEDEKEVARYQKFCEQKEATLLGAKELIFCGDITIEFRPDVLRYETLRKLQVDPRLAPGINRVGNIRVIAGTLEALAKNAE